MILLPWGVFLIPKSIQISNCMKQRSNNFIHPIILFDFNRSRQKKKNERHVKDPTDLETDIKSTFGDIN